MFFPSGISALREEAKVQSVVRAPTVDMTIRDQSISFENSGPLSVSFTFVWPSPTKIACDVLAASASRKMLPNRFFLLNFSYKYPETPTTEDVLLLN